MNELKIEDGEESLGGSNIFYDCPLETLYLGRNLSYSLFSGKSSLKTLTIGNSVTSIGGHAFYNCIGLTSVTIGNSVTSIGDYAFEGCSGLKSMTIPNSVTSIGDYAFSGCSGLTSVTIPNLVTSIGENAFSGCNGLTSVTIPDSVKSIGNGVFEGCSGLTSVTIGNSVTSIGDKAFSGCSGLTGVKVFWDNPIAIDSNVFDSETYNNAKLYIPGNLFAYLASNWKSFENISVNGIPTSNYSDGVLSYRLIENPENPEAVVVAGNYSSLTEVSIPERFTQEKDGETPVRYIITGIAPDAFKNCKSIKAINFNSRSKITEIGESAFSGCIGLTEVKIPGTVTSIGNSAFWYCSGLTKADFASIEALCKISFGSPASNPLYYAHNLYINGEKVKEMVIPESVNSIKDYTFYGCSGLTSVTIPNLVTSIGNNAFSGCSGLTKADFASIEALCKISFGSSASNPLYYAHNLYINGVEVKEVVIPESVNSIMDYTFYGCSGLTSVTIPGSVTSIGSDAFNGCSGLTSVTIPGSVSSIGNAAFNGCTYISELIIEDGEETLSLGGDGNNGLFNDCPLETLYLGRNLSYENSPFEGKSSLKTLTIGNAVTSIGNQAFFGCSGLKEFKLLDGEDMIVWGEEVFKDVNSLQTLYIGRPLESQIFPVSNLTTVTVGNTVAQICSDFLKGASKLRSLTLGSSLTSIGENAFSGCTALTEVIVPPSVETIGASAFAGNSNLASIIMGHNVKTIGEKAFDGCKASTVSITAQTPPTAPNNTFSNYTGKLYLQGKAAIDAYYNAFTCWDRFDSYVMIEPTEMKYDGKGTLSGKAGDTFQLTATLMPENVTLPQIFWRSTNPQIATVDANGLVTLCADLSGVMPTAEGDGDETKTCRIIAESLYANGPVLEVKVTNESADVDDVIMDGVSTDVDFNLPVEVYTLNGARIGNTTDHLAPGIYIIRQGNAVKKIMVR